MGPHARTGIALALVGAIAAGCVGEGPEDSGSARTVKAFLGAFEEGRYAEACERLQATGQHSVAAAGGVDPFDCTRNLEALAQRDTPLDDASLGDISYADEDETADAAEVGTPEGEWLLEQNRDAPEGWLIRGFPVELGP